MSDDKDDVAPQGEQATPEVERKARDMGWVPPSEWRGAPPRDGFLEPQEFVRRGEKIMPIVRAENAKLKTELAELKEAREQDRKEHRENLGRIEKMSTTALALQRKNLEEQYSERKEKAVEVGDMPAYRQAVKDEKEAVKALDERLEPTEAEKKNKLAEDQRLPKHIEDVIDTWKADNRWYEDDPKKADEMSIYATAVHMRLQKEKKGLTLAENLAEVTKIVRKRFPEHFGEAEDDNNDDDQPRRGSRVEGGSRTNGGGRSAYSRLPADAKSQADRFIKEDGLFLEKGETAEKNMATARERYAKQYFGDEA